MSELYPILRALKMGEGSGGGGGGFTPTDAQLDAMNSGITAEDVEQISTNKNNISNLNQNKIGASDYATQNTGGTVRVWTTTSDGETTLHISNEAPTP